MLENLRILQRFCSEVKIQSTRTFKLAKNDCLNLIAEKMEIGMWLDYITAKTNEATVTVKL